VTVIVFSKTAQPTKRIQSTKFGIQNDTMPNDKHSVTKKQHIKRTLKKMVDVDYNLPMSFEGLECLVSSFDAKSDNITYTLPGGSSIREFTERSSDAVTSMLIALVLDRKGAATSWKSCLEEIVKLRKSKKVGQTKVPESPSLPPRCLKTDRKSVISHDHARVIEPPSSDADEKEEDVHAKKRRRSAHPREALFDDEENENEVDVHLKKKQKASKPARLMVSNKMASPDEKKKKEIQAGEIVPSDDENESSALLDQIMGWGKKTLQQME